MNLRLTRQLLLIITLSSCVVLAILGQAKPSAFSELQGTNERRINRKLLADKEPASERILFTENGPSGRWSASIIPDLSKTPATSPVIVTGTSTLMGNAQWRNLQLTHVTLKNYSSKAVLGVQLKWFVTTRTDKEKVLPPPGYTGLFEAYLQPAEMQKFECPLVRFSQAIKYLMRDGALEGDFLLHIRVFQVEFADGSSWNDDWSGPKPGETGELWKGPEITEHNHSPLMVQNTCAHTLCSYYSPDSHPFCDSDPNTPLTCHLAEPGNGNFCTCSADDAKHFHVGRWAWDVFLVSSP